MAAELLAVGLHRTVNVVVSDTPITGDGPTIAVYLGSPAGAADAVGVVTCSGPTVDV